MTKSFMNTGGRYGAHSGSYKTKNLEVTDEIKARTMIGMNLPATNAISSEMSASHPKALIGQQNTYVFKTVSNCFDTKYAVAKSTKNNIGASAMLTKSRLNATVVKNIGAKKLYDKPYIRSSIFLNVFESSNSS